MATPTSAPAQAPFTSLAADISFERCVIRPAQRDLLVDGKPAKLGARAFDLLLTLVEHRNRVVSKNELLELVWPGMIVEENNLQVHISALRKLLGPQVIATIPGRGYRFTALLGGAMAAASSSPATAAINAAATVDATSACIAFPATEEANSTPCEWGNLPVQLPTLFGRDADIELLAQHIKAHRVVSVVGTGGVGKTRLAQAAADTLRAMFTDGVWLVELAPVSDPTLVPAAVAQALGLALPGQRSAQDEVIDALSARTLLLILDNCEHIVAAASMFAQTLVNHSPGVHLLVTSQELLKITGEHVYPLSPLGWPDTNALAAAQSSGAVALFVDRVSSLKPAFTMTEQNVADVIDICRQLDGLPLAIELAAARVPHLGVVGVHVWLKDRFHMLTGGARGTPRRQQTLRETLDWSHSLLAADERAVFRRASVFVGGFTLPAAQHALADDQVDQWAVLDQLSALVDKSLVVADPSEPPRYRLLESARAYALQRLQDAGETNSARERHARAMLALFEEAYAQLWTVTHDVRFERCLPDVDNLRAALDWAQDASDAELHIALAGASAWIWAKAGQFGEGQRRSELALTRIDVTTASALEARLQLAFSEFMYGADELSKLARAADLYRSIGDSRGLYLTAARAVGMSALNGDIVVSEQWLRETELLHDAAWPLASRWHLLEARRMFAYLNHRYDEAETVSDESLRLATKLADVQLVRTAQESLAAIAGARGDLAHAVERGRALIALRRGDRFDQLVPSTLGNYGVALTESGLLDEALPVMRSAALILTRQGIGWMQLDAIALLAFKRGRIDDAALALGRSFACWAKFNQPRYGPITQRIRDAVLSGLRQALPAAELERLLAEGAAMSDEEAARGALAD